MLNRKAIFAAVLSTVAVPAVYLTATPVAANVQQHLENPYVASAQTHFDKGRYREASIELKNALRQDPDHAHARFLLGRILFDRGDLAGASKELGRAYDLNPSDESAVWLAETKLQSGEAEEALELVDGEGSNIDSTIQRLTIKGAALNVLKRFDEAESAYEKSLEIDPRRVEGHFGLAQVYVGRRDLVAAADKLDEIVIGKPDFSPGWMLRGEVALAKGDKQAAFVAFDKAVNLAPETAPPLIARARALLASGDLKRAKADVEDVQRLAENSPISHYLNSAIAYAEGDIDRANRSFTHLQRSFDNFPPAVLLGALIKHQKGAHSQADALLVRYIRMEPENLEARRALASVRLANGQPRNAIDMLQSVLKMAPNDSASVRQMASAQLSLNKYDKAQAAFQRLAQIGTVNEVRDAQMALTLLRPPSDTADPVFANSEVRRTLLKAVDRSSNNDAKAAKKLLDNLRVDESATVLALRGSVESQLGNADQARKLLTRALEIEPEMISAIATFEALDQREGRADDILPRLQKLLKARPKSQMLTLGIAQRMGLEGKRADATKFLSERIGVMPESVSISRAYISALMVEKDFPRAVDEAFRLSTIAPKNPNILTFAANALIDANAPERAVKVAAQVRDLRPKSARSSSLLAEAQAQSGDVAAARKTLQAAMKKWPDQISVVASLVKLEVSEKNQKGVDAATKALARERPNAAARLTATALSEMGQPELAVKSLERAFAKRPDEQLAVDLFRTRRRVGRDEVAFAEMAKWVEANERDRRALLSYATGLLDADRQGEAAVAYEKYLSLEPNNPVALNNYAWLRHQNQRPDALDYAQRAYKAASGSPEIADTYGWMLVTYGKLKEGLDLLQTAKDASPDNLGIQYHFAYALSKAGRKDEAKKILVNVLEGSASFSERAEAEQLMEELDG